MQAKGGAPLATRADAPLSGVFRVVYFLAVGVTSLFVVVTAITAFYSPPEGDSGFPGNASLFGPGTSLQAEYEPTTEQVDLDSFLDAAKAGEVVFVEVQGTTVRYNLTFDSTYYEAEIGEGDTVEGLLLDRGLEPSEFPLITGQPSGDDGGNNDREDSNRSKER